MKTGRFKGQNVCITGGSSGIGLEVAVLFGRLGANLFLVARNPARLQQAVEIIHRRAGPSVLVTPLPADVGVREQIEGVIHRVGREYGGLHTLINNAGVFEPGRLVDLPAATFERLMQVNYFGMLYATRAAWPYLTAARKGHIGLVSSVAGYLGLIGYGAYSPTKFAVAGLAECLRMEAADAGVGVTILFPPDTDTPQLKYENAHALPETLALKGGSAVMSPQAVAQKFVNGICRYRFEVHCNFESKFIRWIKVTWPGLYYRIIDSIVARDRRKRGV